jgi:hypothetical protein
MPSASMAEDMVLAVNIAEQVPLPFSTSQK